MAKKQISQKPKKEELPATKRKETISIQAQQDSGTPKTHPTSTKHHKQG
jgi:hypothetical protein